MSIATAMDPRTPTFPAIEVSEAVLGDTPFLLTADNFLAGVEAGMFSSDERIYLRNGKIYEKMSKTSAHSVLGFKLVTTLIRRLPPGWAVFPEGQFKVNEINTRLPDIAVARGDDAGAFLAPGGYPQARDLVLVVEIAVTSIAKDLGANSERYARALLPTYWVADFSARRILAHTRPRVVDGKGTYEQVEEVGPGGTLPLWIDGREIVRFAYEDMMP